jgi:MFS family permease
MDLCDKSDNRTFFLVYFLIQAVCILAEYPAFKAMQKVSLQQSTDKNMQKIKFSNILIPFQDKKYSLIALITLLHGIIYGSLSAYLVVYLMLTLNWKMSVIIILISVVGLLSNVTLPIGGKITDRYGFPKVFVVQAIIILAMTSVFCLSWNNIWVLLIFFVISWDSCVSIIGYWMTATEVGAGSKLASKGHENFYVSAYNICRSGGLFLGSFCATWLYSFCQKLHSPENHSEIFHTYFSLLLIPIFLLVIIALINFFKNRNQK